MQGQLLNWVRRVVTYSSLISELENMTACLLTENTSGARTLRRPSLSQGVRSHIETFEHFAVTADWVIGYSIRLNDHMHQFLVCTSFVFYPDVTDGEVS
jgi:hypothetical protein